MDAFSRVKLLVGSESYNKLKDASVAVFGVGGVGGYVVEALARSGVGNITVFDNDVVVKTNINRQIIATVDVIGQDKVDAIKERVLSINPNAKVTCHKVFYLPENADEFDLTNFDYVVDAVDTVSAKIEIIRRAKMAGVPVISCMGTGGKIEPTLLRVSNIEKTSGCPLARVMRRELKKRNISNVKVVFSEEQASVCEGETDGAETSHSGRVVPPSMIFVPAVAGLLIAKEVVFDIINGK